MKNLLDQAKEYAYKAALAGTLAVSTLGLTSCLAPTRGQHNELADRVTATEVALGLKPPESNSDDDSNNQPAQPELTYLEKKVDARIVHYDQTVLLPRFKRYEDRLAAISMPYRQVHQDLEKELQKARRARRGLERRLRQLIDRKEKDILKKVNEGDTNVVNRLEDYVFYNEVDKDLIYEDLDSQFNEIGAILGRLGENDDKILANFNKINTARTRFQRFVDTEFAENTQKTEKEVRELTLAYSQYVRLLKQNYDQIISLLPGGDNVGPQPDAPAPSDDKPPSPEPTPEPSPTPTELSPRVPEIKPLPEPYRKVQAKEDRPKEDDNSPVYAKNTRLYISLVRGNDYRLVREAIGFMNKTNAENGIEAKLLDQEQVNTALKNMEHTASFPTVRLRSDLDHVKRYLGSLNVAEFYTLVEQGKVQTIRNNTYTTLTKADVEQMVSDRNTLRVYFSAGDPNQWAARHRINK